MGGLTQSQITLTLTLTLATLTRGLRDNLTEGCLVLAASTNQLCADQSSIESE